MSVVAPLSPYVKQVSAQLAGVSSQVPYGIWGTCFILYCGMRVGVIMFARYWPAYYLLRLCAHASYR